MDQIDLIVERKILKGAVQRQIMCPISGAVLDIRSSVLFTATTPHNGRERSLCLDGETWDHNEPTLRARATSLAAQHNVAIVIAVIDGRVINAKKKTNKRSQK